MGVRDLRSKEPWICAACQIYDCRAIGDGLLDAALVLGQRALVGPFFESEADYWRQLLHASENAFRERIGAGHRDRIKQLTLKYRLNVDRRAGGLESWHIAVLSHQRLELRLNGRAQARICRRALTRIACQ